MKNIVYVNFDLLLLGYVNVLNIFWIGVLKFGVN